MNPQDLLSSYKCVDRIKPTQHQIQCMIDWLNRDKSIFAVIYCKLIEIAFKEETILSYYLDRIKHYLLQDCICTIKFRRSKLHFIENTTSKLLWKGRIKEYKTPSYKNTFIFQLNCHDVQTGLPYFQYLITEPEFPGIYLVDPKLFATIPITECDAFVNMFGDANKTDNICRYLLKTPYLSPFKYKDYQLYKYINPETFVKTTFVKDLSCRMMVKVNCNEIYSFDEIKNKIKDSHNHVSFDPGDPLRHLNI